LNVRTTTLALRGLAHYRAAYFAVVLGVATAVAVLAGALLVGESLRGSLRDQVTRRLGRVDHAVVSAGFFRADLAADLQARGLSTAPVLAHPGVVDAPDTGRRAGGAEVWGVDARFWKLQERPAPQLGVRDALVSEALARELGVAVGGTILLRIRSDDEISGASLFGRRDDPARALRLTVRGVLGADALGEFTLRASQQPVKAVFVPLTLLQRTLARPERVNTLLVAGGDVTQVQSALGAAQLADLGLQLRALPEHAQMVLQADGAYLSDAVVRAAEATAVASGLHTSSTLVHLANTLRVGERSIPYSTIAGVGPELFAGTPDAGPGALPPLFLNEWAAQQLGAHPGATVALEYYVWLESGRLETRHAEFQSQAILPVLAADRELVPRYPGLTEATHMADWEPPFPVDLSRIRPADEEYWDQHRATPKAYIPLQLAQHLFGHREGRVTTVRFVSKAGEPLPSLERVATDLRGRLDATELGLRVEPVRERNLAAARGSTDFGEYFLYFSAFLVGSALLLAGLFFRLGLEQRLPELGVLRALGFPTAVVRRVVLVEAAITSALGSLLGTALAPLWASLLLWALRRFAGDALGTGQVTLHVGVAPLAAGAVGGLVAALLAVVLTLRGLRHTSPRALLNGDRQEMGTRAATARGRTAWALLAGAAALVAGSAWIGSTAAFFGAGTLLLAAMILFLRRALAAVPPWARTFSSSFHLGLRGASFRPGRSLASITLVAAATFLVVAVGAFRHGEERTEDPGSAGGGFDLVATSLVPLHHDPATPEGREVLGLGTDALAGAQVFRFRMRAGDDASCLNLYAPQSPTVLAPTAEFLRAGRFSFQRSLAESPEEKANPWLLLERAPAGGAIPAIADAGSLQYILKKRLGDTMTLAGTGVTVRFVGALSPGLFQGELLVGEASFLGAFPREAGYRFFLVDTPAAEAPRVTTALESALSDFGFDAAPVRDRLAAYHAVENTYIATFQALGALALVLGTVGVAAVLVRNALEQRRELALLRAVGFRRRDLGRMLAAESALVLVLGLAAGALSAVLAIVPALLERGGAVPIYALLLLLLGVAASGLVATRAAVAAVARLPLLPSLRTE
jgi:ABC-type antimicrobial peptide transport system permease subunit